MFEVLGGEFGVVLILLGGLALGLEAGFRTGRAAGRRRSGTEKGGGQLGAIQGAVLGLLGLLLGFSFAAAAARFVEKQDLIVQEANAIRTAYLRADLLEEPHATRLREVLAEYVRHLVGVSGRLSKGLAPDDAAQVADLHARIWSTARDGALAKPAMAGAVLEPVNRVIDLHSTRLFAAQRHTPSLVLALLIACSMLALGAIGYGCGLAGDRALPMTVSLVLVVGATLWTTIDLDYPRAGLLRLSDRPLEQLNLGGPEGALPGGGRGPG